MGLLFGGHGFDLGGSRVLSRAFGDVFEGRGLGSGHSTTPILSPPSHPVKTVPRASTIGVRAAPGINPARRASSGRAPSPCLRGIGPAARGPKARGPWLSPCARSRSLRRRSRAGSSSSRSARSWPPGGPADEARSASPTSAPGSPAARWSPGAAPSTTARAPAYGLAELSRLTGVSPRRARASVKRLVAAGLLTWSDDVIGFPDAGRPRTTTPWPTPSAAGKGALAIPRRILRLLAGGARPALIATAIAVLLRCLARGRGGFRSRGRVKAAWIARTFDVDLRRVKQARAELIDLGWIVPEPDDQWAMNRWGRAYRIDLAWDPDRHPARARDCHPLPPRAAADCHPLILTRNPSGRMKTQEPAPGGPAGVEIQGGEAGGADPDSAWSAFRRRPPSAGGGRREPARDPSPRRPAVIADGAGGGPLPAPTLNDVRVEDLKDTGRLLRLHAQAVARDLVGSSEADRLRFVGAAEHALALGTGNPPGLFMYLVRGRLWRYVTQEDEDRAHARLKRELRGEPPPRSGVGPVASWGRSGAVGGRLVGARGEVGDDPSGGVSGPVRGVRASEPGLDARALGPGVVGAGVVRTGDRVGGEGPHGPRLRPGPGSEEILEDRRGCRRGGRTAALRGIVGPIEAEPSAGDQAGS